MNHLIALLTLACLLSACTTTIVPPPRNADYYLQEGERLFDQELYEDAIATWEKVRDSYYSAEVAAEAELKIAEAHFLAEHYLEASTAYEAFLKNHPNHPKEADIIFQLGLCYFQQILSIDRDQTATLNAKTTLQTYLARFPDHPKADEARSLFRQCQDRLAAHEIYVGNFYLRTEEFQAAIKRLKPVPATYPSSSQLDKAWYYLGLAYLRSGERQSAADAFNALFESYPSSPLIEKAQKALLKEF